MTDFREIQLRETLANLRAREQQLQRDLKLVRAEIIASESKLAEQRSRPRLTS